MMLPEVSMQTMLDIAGAYAGSEQHRLLFFVNEKKRMGILFSRYAGGCRKRYNDTKIKRHPKNAKRVRTLIHPYYTINFRK